MGYLYTNSFHVKIRSLDSSAVKPNAVMALILAAHMSDFAVDIYPMLDRAILLVSITLILVPQLHQMLTGVHVRVPNGAGQVGKYSVEYTNESLELPHNYIV
jgi:hypothetical protein